MARTALAAAALVVLAACGGDEPTAPPARTVAPPVRSAPPATSAPPASEVPASRAPASQVPQAGPTAGKATPEEAARSFYADWGELDRLSASGYATREAIDEAFALQRAQAEFMGCFEEVDHFLCGYYYEGGALNIKVVDTDAYGHIVVDVFYIAD
jgi:hypothetical protein